MLLKFCGKARYQFDIVKSILVENIWWFYQPPSIRKLRLLKTIKLLLRKLNRMLTTFLRRYWIKQQPKLGLPDTLIISFILCSLSGLFSVCMCCDCTCSFIPPFVLNCFEQCWSYSINIVNTGAIVLIYHIVFVIRVYASNVNRGPIFTSADPQANGEESTIELQFSYSKKYDLKKKETEKKVTRVSAGCLEFTSLPYSKAGAK